MRTPRMQREIDTIVAKFPGATAVDELGGSVALIISEFPIPPGFTAPTARIAVRIPALYPSEKLDLFWLDPTLATDGGVGFPNVMAQNVDVAGEQWTQISWHD